MKRVAGISLKRAGFTLLELLIVMAILIVVIGLLGTTVWSNYRKALIRTATVQIESKFNDALEMFFMDFGRYPTQEEGLYILANLTNPNPQPSSNVLVNANANNGMQGMNGATGMNNMQGMNGATGMNDMQGMTGAGDMTGMNNMQGMTGANDMTGMNNMQGMTGANDMTGMNNMQGMTGGFGANDMTGMNNMQGMTGGMPNMTGANGMTPNMTGTNGVQQPQQQQVQRVHITEPYVAEQDLKDPWKQPYRYEWPTTKGDGKKPAVWSCGPDKEDNNGDPESDDIIGWDPNDNTGMLRAQQQQQQNQIQQNGLTNGGLNDINGGMTNMPGANGYNNMPGGGFDTTGAGGFNNMPGGGFDTTGAGG
ncbi:MAG: type II secretion system protein GspG, partial [Thermoguttaceae bacterium]